MVGSGTRNARAISAVVRPARVLSVRATRASNRKAGWQQVKIRRNLSSRTLLSSLAPAGGLVRAWEHRRLLVLGGPDGGAPEPVAGAVSRHRGQPGPGRRGTPSRGHRLERPREGLLRALLGEVPVARRAG